MRSEHFTEFAKALVAFQANASSPPKKKTAHVQMKSGGSYSFSYADLADILEHIRKPLSDAGLSWTSEVDKDGQALRTTIWHTSGEWMDTSYPLGSAADTKAFAGEITYARRYSLTMLLGIAADEDTDGAAPEGAKEYKTKGKGHAPTSDRPPVSPGPISPRGGQAQPAAPRPAAAPSVGPASAQAPSGPSGTAPAAQPALAGEAERTHLAALAKAKGWSGADVIAYLQTAFKKATVAELTMPQYQEMAAVLASKAPGDALSGLQTSQPFDQFKDRR